MSTTAPTITMYWRPGCGFCAGLQRDLDGLGVEYAAVNIWEDPDGAAFVRSVNGGNELVPTVTVGDEALSNPSPAAVLAAVHAQDPDSTLPQPPEPGRLAKGMNRLLGG